jgi:hypothetical protein
MNGTNDEGADQTARGRSEVREHVRAMLQKLRDRLQAEATSVDHTVEVDREQNRSGGVNGI